MARWQFDDSRNPPHLVVILTLPTIFKRFTKLIQTSQFHIFDPRNSVSRAEFVVGTYLMSSGYSTLKGQEYVSLLTVNFRGAYFDLLLFMN
ncbi:MAG: hypothetical protein C5B47_07540 [Verrucomicrobia bacterium]|nr:MAG: hypothetical protein C5B47_07540 [Verrucomicrobiota bacterium]